MVERQSNIELLRILAMLMILVVHFDGAALGLPAPGAFNGAADWVKTAVEALSITGVNLFILISGYFGIRTRGRRLLNYLGMCAFYYFSFYAIFCFIDPKVLTWKIAASTVLFISHGDLWFVRDYFFLMLLAPLINAGLDNMTARGRNLTALAVVVLSCYFGWLWHCEVNPSGYNLVQMITMYVIGSRLPHIDIDRRSALAIYIMSTLAICGCAWLLPAKMAYAYNSPFVMTASVSLFMVFESLEIRSVAVNRIARYTFAVYLVHKNPYVWPGWLAPLERDWLREMPAAGFIASMATLTIAVYAASLAIEWTRRAVGHLCSQTLLPTKNED